MKTKEEVIREAWGEYYEIVKDEINDNGWYNFFDLDCTERKRKLWHFENVLMTQSEEGHYIRPKSLKGIENNNRWISIKSEEDLPKEKGSYWILSINEDAVSTYFNGIDFVTHYGAYTPLVHTFYYQPIIKPKKPLY